MLTVFVYGTLRAGESNDIRCAADRHAIEPPRLIGEATVRGWLHDFGAYPGLVRSDAATPVRGEVYEIVSALLPVLDGIEEIVPGRECLFMRDTCDVEVEGRLIACLYYPIREASSHGLPRIEGGDWVSHHRARRDLAA
ncbi:MAG TPA: gamma-glutamylcyclotransferase family protein [Pararobbsia sp.]|nr:gamma-glutamylcyclotransferase family protein [Pararobbsia sp.]